MCKCKIHNVHMVIKEVPEYPSKTMEVCPVCEKEAKVKLRNLFPQEKFKI